MSMKVSKKALKEYAKGYNVVDLTESKKEELETIEKKEGYFNKVCYCEGVYGCNGVLLQGNNTKQLYTVVGRCGNLFRLN